MRRSSTLAGFLLACRAGLRHNLRRVGTMLDTLPVLVCPTCNRAMDHIVTEALPDDAVRSTYRCERCGGEIEQKSRTAPIGPAD
jgi:hypothetical protein